jgi:hypothetical protein
MNFINLRRAAEMDFVMTVADCSASDSFEPIGIFLMNQ